MNAQQSFLKRKKCVVEKGLSMKILIRSKGIFKEPQNCSHILNFILAGLVPERKRRLRCGCFFSEKEIVLTIINRKN